MTMGAGALALGNTRCDPAIMRRVQQIEGRRDPRHAVWVWQFSLDGEAATIADTLASYGLAAIVKTHDGVEWMATYDHVPGAIDGPGGAAIMARVFEAAGVPFHAWAVVKGVDPAREAHMAAAVLDAGARSLTLDLEPGDGFWQGTPDDARRFGAELRARHEYARVDVSIDPRPWKLWDIPLNEFAEFTDGIRPQLYWQSFADQEHINAYTFMGDPPGPRGITPEFVVDATHRALAPLDRWLLPVGLGGFAEAGDWARLHRRAWELQMPELSVWRYGLADPSVLAFLAAHPPGTAPPA
jgi:hypothetical protein